MSRLIFIKTRKHSVAEPYEQVLAMLGNAGGKVNRIEETFRG